MRSGILLIINILLALGGFSQTEKCATVAVSQHKLAKNPALVLKRNQANDMARQWREGQNTMRGASTLTIPVVVHVLYLTPTDSISQAQVWSQIEILNNDYSRMNADAVNTRSVFGSLATSMDIQFCLATTDPQGSPTSGITYTLGNPGFFGFYDPFTENAKSNASGGKDPWPTDQYLNIWVCKMFPGLLGYAQFPGDDPLTDGVVINYQSFGNIGTVVSPSTGGRTATHEIGHWLGLRHIWGDGGCGVVDSVADTPDADASYSTCDTTRNTCTESPGPQVPDMMENYMDYSPDSCMNMFTIGQRDRAWSFLNTDRASLFSSNGCLLASADPSILKFKKLEAGPNPAENFLRFYFPEPGNDWNIVLIDMNGRKILQAKGREINLEKIPSGMYSILASGYNQIYSGKIIVQK